MIGSDKPQVKTIYNQLTPDDSQVINDYPQPRILATESIYYLLIDNQSDLFLNSNKNQIISIFESIPYFYQFIKDAGDFNPAYIKSLASAFLPGPLQLIIKDKNNQKIVAYMPAELDRSQIIKNYPLAAIGIYSRYGIALTDPKAIQRIYSNAYIINASVNFQRPNGIEPTLIDCSNQNQIQIIKTGLIRTQDIVQVIPKNIQVFETKPNPRIAVKVRNQEAEKNLTKKQNSLVVIGSKERLLQQFNIKFNNHFRILEVSNLTLINLGSQTSLQTIAKSLTKNLQSALEIAEKKQAKLYILHQDWGKNQWGKIIESYLNSAFIKSYW